MSEKILDSSLRANALCIIGTFFDMYTANRGFGHVAQNFELFLVGVIIICFSVGPPMCRR